MKVVGTAEICALPSMAGARLRQRPLSKIVPDDFVELATWTDEPYRRLFDFPDSEPR